MVTGIALASFRQPASQPSPLRTELLIYPIFMRYDGRRRTLRMRDMNKGASGNLKW